MRFGHQPTSEPPNVWKAVSSSPTFHRSAMDGPLGAAAEVIVVWLSWAYCDEVATQSPRCTTGHWPPYGARRSAMKITSMIID